MSGLLPIPPRLFGFPIAATPKGLEPFVAGLVRYLDLVYSTFANALRVSTQITQAGTLTVSAAATTGTFTFPTAFAEPDTSYFVTAVPVTVSAGATAGSSRVRSIAKAVSGITLTVEAAPGGAESVVFDVLVVRQPAP